MKKLVALLLVSLMATVAFAGLDTDANSFGVYFDTLGNTNTTTAMDGVTKYVYILLMNPSTDIKGFELAYELVPEASMAPTFADDLLRTLQTIANLGAGIGYDFGNSADALVGDYRVGYTNPRPAVPAMLMVSWRFRYYGEQDLGIQFFLKGVAVNPSIANGLPVLLDNLGAKKSGYLASGSPLIPCAGTAGLAPVAEEINSFGSVKSLFR